MRTWITLGTAAALLCASILLYVAFLRRPRR